jgi:hypothetical protein
MEIFKRQNNHLKYRKFILHEHYFDLGKQFVESVALKKIHEPLF